MMVRTKLPPGFRFHPTDVELVMYYLKRKVTGSKFNFEAISELNIYKFSPWDLPDKSCLKSKDLEWYFFCPRERKYASGVRMNRTTETGFWKATGKDRSVKYNGNIVGMVRTLVFHKGNAPHGTRTDWLIYEYRIENKSLADNGVAQDSYVLCKVFQKNGPGPKNGAQYGAPFQEEDWDDDDCDIPVDSLLDCPFPLQQNQNSSAALGLVGLEPGPSVVQHSLDKVPWDGNSCSMVTNMGAPANISGHSPIEAGVSLQDLSADDMIIDTQNDDIARMLASFVDDPLPLTGNENNEVFHPDQRGEIPMVTNSDDCDPFSGLDDINNLADFNVGGTNFHEMAFLELDDLNPPLDFSAETFAIGELQSNGSYGQSDFGCSQHDLPESSCTQNHSYSDLSPIENRGSVPGYGGCLTDSHQRPRVPDPSNILGNSATAAPVVRCIYRPTSPANILNFSTYKPEGTRNCRETGKR